ncbi:MAG: TolC family protein [Bacteroidales bacterium]|nr:TolC family protein [Bacteroidales bacterium]
MNPSSFINTYIYTLLIPAQREVIHSPEFDVPGPEMRPAPYRYSPGVTCVLIFLMGLGIFMMNPVPANSQESMTLQKALQVALENNYGILLQKNEAKVAGNNNTVGNAGFLPSVALDVTLNNTINTTHQEQFSGTVKDVNNAKNNSLNAGVALDWTVFDGLRMFATKKMMNILEELGNNGTKIVVEGTVSDVSLTWYGMIQTAKLVKVAREAADLSLQRKRISEAKVSIGSGSQLMLLQSTVDLNADSTRLLQQQVALANLKVDFNRILSRDVGSDFEIDEFITITKPLPFDLLWSQAQKQNTQLIAARLNQQYARSGVQQAEADRYPQLDLSAGYSYGTLNSQTGFLKFNRSYGLSYGLTLSYNLFNGFNVNRAVKNAKIALNSGEIEVQDATLSLHASLLKTYQEFQANIRIVELQESNVKVARENVTIAFEKYKLGTLNDIELREIQQKLIDAEYELIYAQFEAKKAEVEILRLTGQLTLPE